MFAIMFALFHLRDEWSTQGQGSFHRLWVSLPLAWAIGQTVAERGLLWPALSAGAILLERVSSVRVSGVSSSQRQAAFLEDREN